MQLRQSRILLVDDHQPMREILKSLLYGLGAGQLSEASDAAQALELLQHAAFDILFTDYDMPGGTGVQLAHGLRRAEGLANRRIPIVMITGRAEAAVIAAARDAGIDEYLVKPLTAASLCQKIDAVLGHRRPFIEAPSYVGPDRRRRPCAHAGPERRVAMPALARSA
jgi:two-component system chemotaxis response regulator CheY